MKVPILMITYNRLSYTKQALEALLKVRGAEIYIIDNCSTDGTVEYLESLQDVPCTIFFFAYNAGIAGAMNWFLDLTTEHEFVAKVDNDTLVSPDFIEKMLPHMEKADIVQAKHSILKATNPDGFDSWVKTMKQDGQLRYHHFVGGSGILFKRKLVDKIPETEWKIGGWRQWQREHPEIKKAFACDVEIKLLDTDESGAKYEDYPDYYVETKRTCLPTIKQ